jgi:hypothetical protein
MKKRKVAQTKIRLTTCDAKKQMPKTTAEITCVTATEGMAAEGSVPKLEAAGGGT